MRLNSVGRKEVSFFCTRHSEEAGGGYVGMGLKKQITFFRLGE